MAVARSSSVMYFQLSGRRHIVPQWAQVVQVGCTVSQSDTPGAARIFHRSVHWIGSASDGYAIALFFSRHFICQRAVQKLELSSDVNMFDKNAVNGVTKKLFTISKNYKIATNGCLQYTITGYLHR